jgi:tetratricopeptide (TPR) repeat protein
MLVRNWRWLLGPAGWIILLAGLPTLAQPLAVDDASRSAAGVRTKVAAGSHIAEFLSSLPRRQASSVREVKAEEQALAEAAVADFPNKAEPLYLLAVVFRGHGNVQQSESLLKEALSLDPSQSRVYEELGVIAQERDQLDLAEATWRRGLEANPKSPSLRWHIADVRVLQGRLEGTEDLLKAECDLTPKASRNYFLLGQVHLKLKEYEQARRCYEQALALQPDFHNAYYGLAMVYTRLQDPNKASECMKTFQRLKAGHDSSDDQRIVIDELPAVRARVAGLCRQVYSLYAAAGQTSVGEILLRRATVLDPNAPLNWERLAACTYQQGRLQDSLTSFQRARQLDPNNPLFAVNIGTLYGVMRQPDQAEACLREAIRQFPDCSLAYAELAKLYLMTHRSPAAAKALAQKAVDLDPLPPHWFLLARACDVVGDSGGAAEAVQKAMAAEPDNPRYKDFYAYLQSKR